LRLRGERGSVLVEVMVGAVVLAIATTALLNGIDGAQSAGGTNKARSTAAALAEQDQERLRSLPVASLASCCTPPSRPVTVRGVTYTVTSSVEWVTDQGGPITCSNNSKTAANLKITSAVTSPATKGVVDEVSLVTPPPGTFSPGQGRAIVKVNDRNGAAKVGANVNLLGTTSYSGTTNSLGCAIFPFVNVGTYTASVGAGQYVDWQGNSPSTKGLTVSQSTSTTASLEMDTAAEIRAIFETQVGTATAFASKSQWITLQNSKLTVGQKIVNAGSPATTISATGLFPFLDGYRIFAGGCTANNPSTYGATLPTYSPTPGQILTMGTTNDIRTPSINVQVLNASGSVASTSTTKVFVASADSGCSQSWSNLAISNPTYGGIQYPSVLTEPGFPYGTYRLCAQASATGPHGHADVRSGGVWSDNGTSVLNESTNPATNEVVSNTAAGGTPLTPPATATNGAVRIKMTRSGACH
jgi:hypothetical protein